MDFAEVFFTPFLRLKICVKILYINKLSLTTMIFTAFNRV